VALGDDRTDQVSAGEFFHDLFRITPGCARDRPYSLSSQISTNRSLQGGHSMICWWSESSCGLEGIREATRACLSCAGRKRKCESDPPYPYGRAARLSRNQFIHRRRLARLFLSEGLEALRLPELLAIRPSQTQSDVRSTWTALLSAQNERLTSNLNRPGVDGSGIQRILRHSTVATTQNHSIEPHRPMRLQQ
jgi:hypothetical protein